MIPVFITINLCSVEVRRPFGPSCQGNLVIYPSLLAFPRDGVYLSGFLTIEFLQTSASDVPFLAEKPLIIL